MTRTRSRRLEERRERVQTYLLEAYVPDSDDRRLSDLDAAARGAARAHCRRGCPVRLIRSIYLSGDETCFLLLETRERSAAEELGCELDLAVVRLAEAITVPQS